MMPDDKDREIGRFNEGVDRLIGGGAAEEDDFEGRMAAAAKLASVDFSDASRVRESLRARLLDRDERGPVSRMLRALAGMGLSGRMFAAPAVAVIAFVVVAVIWPGAISAAARQVEEFVQDLIIGRNTTVSQVEPESIDIALAPDFQEVFSGDGATIWISKTTIIDPGESREQSAIPSIGWVFDSLEGAQVEAGFHLRSPAYLPDGYSLRDVRVTPSRWVIAAFEGPKGFVLLAQVPGDSGLEAVTSTDIEVLTDRPIRPVQVNGMPAAWSEGRSLSWVEGDVSYTIAVDGLSLDEALRMAESLQ